METWLCIRRCRAVNFCLKKFSFSTGSVLGDYGAMYNVWSGKYEKLLFCDLTFAGGKRNVILLLIKCVLKTSLQCPVCLQTPASVFYPSFSTTWRHICFGPLKPCTNQHNPESIGPKYRRYTLLSRTLNRAQAQEFPKYRIRFDWTRWSWSFPLVSSAFWK
jgi:hypothetical protein